MRILIAVIAGTLIASTVLAQERTAAPASTSSPTASPTEDTTGVGLPVSLTHIRVGLKKESGQSLLRDAEWKADFRIEIEEQERINDILSKLDFKAGPAPAGGLYGYDQQRRLFSPTDRPLAQPYAAFSGGELITIALENLIGRRVAERLSSAVSDARRRGAIQTARDEVDKAIAEFCAGRPDRADIQLCSPPDR
jgi:hypothetical protein